MVAAAGAEKTPGDNPYEHPANIVPAHDCEQPAVADSVGGVIARDRHKHGKTDRWLGYPVLGRRA